MTDQTTDSKVPAKPVRMRPPETWPMQFLQAIASLKLTIVLLVLGIILVMLGTLAQWRMDPHQALNKYFRNWVASIEPADLTPQSLFPDTAKAAEVWEISHQEQGQGALTAWFSNSQIPERAPRLDRFHLYFPGGIVIGGLMLLNLLAAHGVKFKLTAKGNMLPIGLAVTVLGIVVSVAIVMTHQGGITKGVAPEYETPLWIIIAITCAAGWFGCGYALMKTPAEQLVRRWFYIGAGLISLAAAVYIVYIEYHGRGQFHPLKSDNTRILWQLIQAQLASGLLLYGCYLLFNQRAGIVLLHSGIALLLVNELIVHLSHVETSMTIFEKDSEWAAHDLRHTELAIERRIPKVKDATNLPDKAVSNSPADLEVYRVPIDLLWDTKGNVSKGRVKEAQLPFEFEAIRYFSNGEERRLQPNEKPLATAGRGLTHTYEERRRLGGNSSETDQPVLWVKVFAKDASEPLGVYVLGSGRGTDSRTEEIIVPTAQAPQDDQAARTYELSYRFVREYKPYRIELHDVRKDDYLGSNTPRNYSSDITLRPLGSNDEFTHHIKMNSPLRFEGETFYQANYIPGRIEATTLQIVKNVGWMIPYFSCMVVFTGLTFQFLSTMNRFLNREERQRFIPVAQAVNSWEQIAGKYGFYFGSALFLLIVAYIGSRATPRSVADTQPDLVKFGSLPTIFQGRMLPLDTLARNSLKTISRSESYTDNPDAGMFAAKERYPAIQWLLELWSDFETFEKRKIIFIEHFEVTAALGLERRKSHLYSWSELTEKSVKDVLTGKAISPLTVLERNLELADNKEPERLSSFDKKMRELAIRVRIIEQLRMNYVGEDIQTLLNEADQQGSIAMLRGLRKLERANLETPLILPFDMQADIPEMSKLFQQMQQRMLAEVLQSVPAGMRSQIESGFKLDKLWTNTIQPPGVIRFWESVSAFQNAEKPDQNAKKPYRNASLAMFDQMLAAYQGKKYAEFNTLVNTLHQTVETKFMQLDASQLGKVKYATVPFESWFNQFNPFAMAMPIYLILAILGLLAIVIGKDFLQPALLLPLIAVFALHTAGLIMRIYISGRPPVTNLYSTGLFIGWGIVLFCIAFEAYMKNAIALAVAGFAGFFTLMISNNLYGDINSWSKTGGDTMGVMQAVLDTDFWLGTHVVTVSLGYSMTLLAGLLGAVTIFFGVFSQALDQTKFRDLYKMNYGIVCFGLLFSFVGTVLGGLWADDSWGRFWGWDPKENGALLIVMWNAIVLHARWDGMIKERGFAVLTVFGAVVTSWSWFGVNELGVGLHSYGFTEGVLQTLGYFAAGSLLVMAIGCLPKKYWLSSPHLEHDA